MEINIHTINRDTSPGHARLALACYLHPIGIHESELRRGGGTGQDSLFLRAQMQGQRVQTDQQRVVEKFLAAGQDPVIEGGLDIPVDSRRQQDITEAVRPPQGFREPGDPKEMPDQRPRGTPQ